MFSHGLSRLGRDTEHQPSIIEQTVLEKLPFLNSRANFPRKHVSKQEHVNRGWALRECWGTDTAGAPLILVYASSYLKAMIQPSALRAELDTDIFKANYVYTHIGTCSSITNDPILSVSQDNDSLFTINLNHIHDTAVIFEVPGRYSLLEHFLQLQVTATLHLREAEVQVDRKEQ